MAVYRVIRAFCLVLASISLVDAVAAQSVRVRGCCIDAVEREGVVSSGLRWLAVQQQPDGRWLSPPEPPYGEVHTPPRVSATHSTALVLLAYLGAGQTHRDGDHSDTVKRGVLFLTKHMAEREELGDLRDGDDMTAHGVATLALSEAYALSYDKKLIAPAQLAVRFCERQQSRATGGWRSRTDSPDDMHVGGWQSLALYSAQQAFLFTSENTRTRWQHYLDGQRLHPDEIYGRHMPGHDVQATAIALFSRAALGEIDDRASWNDAVKWATGAGPAAHDVERNYWITQVARQADKDTWNDWSGPLRSKIIASQISEGADGGSWHDAHDIAAENGRVYQTALNIMCLGVYYRYLTTYREWPALKTIKPPVANDVGASVDDDPFAN